jgi:hypothetical protein
LGKFGEGLIGKGTKVGAKGWDYRDAHIGPPIGPAAVRRWDLARAAKAEKMGFWADIAGIFFIFRGGGRCAP